MALAEDSKEIKQKCDALFFEFVCLFVLMMMLLLMLTELLPPPSLRKLAIFNSLIGQLQVLCDKFVKNSLLRAGRTIKNLLSV